MPRWEPAPFDCFQTTTVRSESCGLRLVFQHRVTGRFYCPERPCWQYSCHTCGPKRLERHYESARYHLGGAEFVWVATIPGDEKSRKMVNKRMSRKGLSSLSIEHSRGFVRVFANGDFGGRLASKTCRLNPQVAMHPLHAALRYPGLVKVRGSKGWPMPNEEPKGFGPSVWERVAVTSTTNRDAAFELARQLYEQRGGLQWESYQEQPSDYEPAVWRGLFLEALEAVRQGRQLGA